VEDLKALLEQLKMEEETLQFKSFTNETAFQLGTQCVEAAMKQKLPITIDICRGEQQLFHAALTETSADNDEWIKRKNRVVNRFLHSSFLIGTRYKLSSSTILESSLLDPTEYAPHGGAFPIIIENVGVIGTITVSGLPQKEDHEFVVKLLKQFLNKDN
jgi:uncharacterized protein (UPF0303 family)